MGCAIDEVTMHDDSVTVWAEGQCITFVLSEGKLVQTAFSENYFGLFRFRPLCQVEHKEAALKTLLEINQKTPTAKKRKPRKKKGCMEKEIDPYQPFKNPYPVSPANFPVGEDGEYIGHSAAYIANYVSALFREEKRSGITKPNFKEIADKAFEELGFVGKNLSAIRSALSKEIWRRRKARAAAIFQRKIEEAGAAERNHLLPLEV